MKVGSGIKVFSLVSLTLSFLSVKPFLSKGVRTSTLQLSAMREGDYTYQLTVTDSAGHQSTANVTVIVQPGKLWDFV